MNGENAIVKREYGFLVFSFCTRRHKLKHTYKMSSTNNRFWLPESLKNLQDLRIMYNCLLKYILKEEGLWCIENLTIPCTFYWIFLKWYFSRFFPHLILDLLLIAKRSPATPFSRRKWSGHIFGEIEWPKRFISLSITKYSFDRLFCVWKLRKYSLCLVIISCLFIVTNHQVIHLTLIFANFPGDGGSEFWTTRLRTFFL